MLLHGARQTGKTTLVRAVAEGIGSRYATLDDLTTLAAPRIGDRILRGSVRFLVVVGMMLAAAASRLIPHPHYLVG